MENSDIEKKITDLESVAEEIFKTIDLITLEIKNLSEQFKTKEFPISKTINEIVPKISMPIPLPEPPKPKPKKSAKDFFIKDYTTYPEIYAEFDCTPDTPEKVFSVNVKSQSFKELLKQRYTLNAGNF